MSNRNRALQLNFRVSENELNMIEKKMAQADISNREAYLRKMAIDGYVLRLEVPELKQLLSLMRYAGNNINQIARWVNENGRIYENDLHDVLERQNEMLERMREILSNLSALS